MNFKNRALVKWLLAAVFVLPGIASASTLGTSVITQSGVADVLDLNCSYILATTTQLRAYYGTFPGVTVQLAVNGSRPGGDQLVQLFNDFHPFGSSCASGLFIDFEFYRPGTPGTGIGNYYLYINSADGAIDKYYPYHWDGTHWYAGNAGDNPANTLPWGAISFPSVFSTSSVSIATSSGLWNNLSVASSSINCSGGNLFSNGLCTAVSYLFIPDPNTLNGLQSIPALAEGKFPFSWLFSIKTTLSGLSVSGATSSFAYNWGSLSGASSSMGQLIPTTIPVFGLSTIETYLGSSWWGIFQDLIAAALWLWFGLHVYRRAQALAQPHK